MKDHSPTEPKSVAEDRNTSERFVPTTGHDDRQLIDLADPVGDLADAWLVRHRPAPMASPASALRCQIPGCSAIPFVQLKTAAGPYNVCLSHFQSIKDRARYTRSDRSSA